MKKAILRSLIGGAVLSFAAGSASAVAVLANNNASELANVLAGTGIVISNATMSAASQSAAGTFTDGGNIGFDSGVLLTTGALGCAIGPNLLSNCTGPGATTSLKFDFTSASGNVFFNFVFASEEYTEFVDSTYNDLFELNLNGVNIAMLPGAGGVVSINNVNHLKNSAYFRNNNTQAVDSGYDGLTSVLTATATGLTGVNRFEILIKDQGDESWDSGVFIKARSFSDTPTDVPEPGSLALLGLALLAMFGANRRKAGR